MTVIYAAVPCFYAAVERAAAPDLAGRPVIVGGDPRKRGLVQSASCEALEAGVEVGMPVLEALERCPRARALRTNMRRYREASQRLRAIFRRQFERVEPAGLEAAYIGLAGGEGEPETQAQLLCEQTRSELGLPLRIGIARVRFVAKIASEVGEKPGWQRVAPGREAAFLQPLPVGSLPGVGPNTQMRLEALGVRSIGDLLDIPSQQLEEAFGNRGREFVALARGEGEVAVRGMRHPQSRSQESTLEQDQLDVGVLSDRLLELARSLEAGLRVDGLVARRVGLKVRYGDLETTSRRLTLREPVARAAALHAVAVALLRRTQAGARAVRLIGISVSELTPAAPDESQLDLFSQR
ncbi:MAG: DNA polymerase IV [Deltaproteobacteria bacterium]|nr:MAG: DNA polymerase IV [Deltaproteobacteria bacterium]